MAGQARRKRHKPEESVAKLRQADEQLAAGKEIGDAERAIGVSEVTLRRARQQYGTLQHDDVRRLREPQAENGQRALVLPPSPAGTTRAAKKARARGDGRRASSP
ncbi:MAG: hypothetical protein U0575_08715 [Phycisphaerales bacterium]|jgi:hypothetical protein